MKRILGLVTAMALLALGTNAMAAAFGAGNIVVVRVGNGSQTLTNLGNSVFLDEYTTNSIWANAGSFTSPTPVQSILMPTNWVGSQAPLIFSGIATAAGGLNRSADGRYLALTGYGTTLNNVTNSPSSLSGTNFSLSSTTTTGQFNQVARVVGLVDGNGHVYTGITLTSADEDDEEPRCAVTIDGTNVWLAGDTTGTKYLTGGRTSMTSTQVGTSANTRFITISSNTLYYSANHVLGAPTNTSLAINPFGGSMPTSFVKSNFLLLAGVYGDTITNSPAKGSPFAFSFVNTQGGSTPDTLYVADNVTNAPGEPIGKAGGVLKYCYVPASNAWVGFGYIFADQAYGVTAVKNGPNVDLYITEGGTVTPLNAVYPYTDFSGYQGSPQSNGDGGDANGNKVLINPVGNGNMNTRGIAFAPQGGDGGTLTPAGGITAGPPFGPYFRGAAGGPFGPTNYVYSICNLSSTTTTNWFLQLVGFGSPAWLGASATSGTLAPGQSTTVTLTPTAGANSRQGGATYTGTVVFRNNNITGTTALSVPAQLVVDAFFDSPNSNYTAVGSPGGPFSPSNIVYTITNATASARAWGITNSATWYTVSATNGTLAGNATTNITVSINATANSLPIGLYSDTIAFLDVAGGNHLYDSHFVNLQVGFGFFDDFSSVNYSNGPIVGQQNWYNPTVGFDDDPYNIVGGVLVLPDVNHGCNDSTLQEPAKSISSSVVTNPGFVYLGISLTVTSAYSTAATWDFAMEPFLFGGTVQNNKARTSVNDIGGGNYRWNTHVNGFDSLRPGTIARAYNQQYFVYIVSDVANSNCWVFVNPPSSDTNALFAMTPDAHDGPDVVGWGGPSSGGIGGIDIDHFCSSSTQAGMLIYKIAMSTNYSDVFTFLTTTNSPPPADPFTTWQSNYFTVAELGTPSFSGPNADPFGKGMSNTNQFLAGFNPTNASAYVHITAISKTNSGSDVRVDFLGASGDSTYSPGLASRTNVLEFTTGTANGSYNSNGFASAGVTDILSGGVGLGTLTNMVDPGGATNKPARYYRVRVLVP